MIEHKHILFFDGICVLCSGFVRIIHFLDKNNKIRFATLQSEYWKAIEQKHQITTPKYQSVIYYKEGAFYQKSHAIIELARTIGGWLNIFSIFTVIPLPIRDALYDFVARNRFRWFGKRPKCQIGDKALNEKVIN